MLGRIRRLLINLQAGPGSTPARGAHDSRADALKKSYHSCHLVPRPECPPGRFFFAVQLTGGVLIPRCAGTSFRQGRTFLDPVPHLAHELGV
jgi:hypothetical protein